MPRSLTQDIRYHLAAYLHGETTLDQFRDWFVPVLWTVEDANDNLAERLAYEIEALHSEYVQEHWSRDEFHQRLWSLVERPESLMSGSNEHGDSLRHVTQKT